MARIVKPLTFVEIDNAKPKDKDYKLIDGYGLFLFISRSDPRQKSGQMEPL